MNACDYCGKTMWPWQSQWNVMGGHPHTHESCYQDRRRLFEKHNMGGRWDDAMARLAEARQRREDLDAFPPSENVWTTMRGLESRLSSALNREPAADITGIWAVRNDLRKLLDQLGGLR